MANNDWFDVTHTSQSDISWAFRKYSTPKYIFAEDYDIPKIKEKILKTRRIKDAIEKVSFQYIYLSLRVTLGSLCITYFINPCQSIIRELFVPFSLAHNRNGPRNHF